jgi:NRPS condensation-like uncharacterized protein
MLEKLPNRKFERKVTSAECFFARAPFTIVTMVARIKGNVSEEMLRNAVGKVQRRHVLLRVRIQYDQDHQPWFTSEGIQEIPIEVVPRGSENDWIRIHVQALKDPYAFETHPAIRFILVQSPDSSELIILCHHIICDGMSLAYLARDLMVHLGEPEREVEVLPAPPIIDLDNLPGDVSQSGLVKSLIKRMNQQWAEEGATFDHEDYKILTKAYWDTYTHELFSIELSEAETSLLAARCREENVTVNAAITVSFSAAQSLVEGEKSYHSQLAIGANLRDRLPDPPGEGMGYYAGAVELKFKYNHKRGFWENARTFLKNFQKKYTNKNLFRNILNWLYLEPSMMEAFHFKKLGGLVPSDSPSYEKLSSFSKEEDVVFRILKRDKLESLERKHWGIAVTNLGRLDFPKTYGPLELDRLIMQPGGGIPLANVNMVIGAVTCSGKLCLVVEYTEQAIDPGAVGKIKEKAMEFLLNEPV